MYNELEAKAKHALLQIADDQMMNTGNYKSFALDLSRNNSRRRSRVRSLLSDDILFNNMHLLSNGVSKANMKQSSPSDSRKNNHNSEKTTPRQSEQLKSLISSRNKHPQADSAKPTQTDSHRGGISVNKKNTKETNLTPNISCNINIYSTSITSWNSTSKRNNTNDNSAARGFLFPGQKEEKRGTIRESVFLKPEKQPLGESGVKKQEIDFSKMAAKLHNINPEEIKQEAHTKPNHIKNTIIISSNQTTILTQRNEITKQYADCFQAGFLQFKYQNRESPSKNIETEMSDRKQGIVLPKQQSEVSSSCSISPRHNKGFKKIEEHISNREQQQLSKKQQQQQQKGSSFDDSNIKFELETHNKSEVTTRKLSQNDEQQQSMKDRILNLITTKRRRSELQNEFKSQQLQYQQSKLQQQQSQKIVTPKVLQDLQKDPTTPQPTITTADPTPRSLGNVAKTPEKQISPFFLSQIPSPSLCVSRYQPSPIGSNLHQFHHSLRRNRHHKLRFQMVSNSQQQQQQQPSTSIPKLPTTNTQEAQFSQQQQELEKSLQQAYELMQQQCGNKENNKSEIFPCLKQLFKKVSRSVDQKCPSELTDYKKRSEKPPQRARSRVCSYLENKSSPLESILQSSRQLDGGSPLQQLLRQSQHQRPILTLASPTCHNAPVIIPQQQQKTNRSLGSSSEMTPLIQVTPILLQHPLNQITILPQSSQNNNFQNGNNNFSKANHFFLPSLSPTCNNHKLIQAQSPKFKQSADIFEYSSLSPKMPLINQKIKAI